MVEASKARPAAQELIYGGGLYSAEDLLRRQRTLDESANSAETYRRYQALVARAIRLFGDKVSASRWLSSPSVDFDGEVPLQIAMREGYAPDLFEPVFVRIEHGVDF